MSSMETIFEIFSERVKSVDFHPEQSLILLGLHSGDVQIWNYEKKELVKSIKVGAGKPVRCAKFIARNNWLVVGSDDGLIRVFSTVHFELLRQFEAHSDFVRSLAVHPVLPFVISASDDKTVKVWSWAMDWTLVETFEGHGHYVMHVSINPHAPDTVASASLDGTVKIWQLEVERKAPLKTLKGHTEGVNCVVFQSGSRILTGSDDKTVKVWDWKNDVYTPTDLVRHDDNVTCILENGPSKRVVSGSEDGTLRVLVGEAEPQKFQVPAMERVWSLAEKDDFLAVGCDNGVLICKV